jgi:hypothetical protein
MDAAQSQVEVRLRNCRCMHDMHQSRQQPAAHGDSERSWAAARKGAGHQASRVCAVQVLQTAVQQSAQARLRIIGRNAFGNVVSELPFAGTLLDTPVVTPAGPTLALSDTAPGEAVVHFASNTTGSFSVSITAGGQHLQGSPFPLEVVPSITPDATKTRAWGSAIEGALRLLCTRRPCRCASCRRACMPLSTKACGAAGSPRAGACMPWQHVRGLWCCRTPQGRA